MSSCVNTLDLDKRTLKAKTWIDTRGLGPNDGGMLTIRITRFRINGNPPTLSLTSLPDSEFCDKYQNSCHPLGKPPICNLQSDTLDQNRPLPEIPTIFSLHSDTLDKELATLHYPTPLGLFHEQLMLDIVHQWKSFFDDHDAWGSSLLLYKTLCNALLRVAALDFDISDDLPSSCHDLPTSHIACPGWKANPANIFWYHQLLIVLCPDAADEQAGTQALQAAKVYLKGTSGKVILFSLPSIVVVTINSLHVQCSKPFPLLISFQDTEFDHSRAFDTMTDGLHLLKNIFTSVHWRANKQLMFKYYPFPIELWEKIYQYVDRGTRRKFAQAAPLFEQIYHSQVPELQGLRVISLPIHEWDTK
ncbi:hypothetical protein L228DRAFT_279391 [Xylona heveae TC161]|uniref:Uncharacterized protein n=1 Tax=Xylona heveae (strain CBS 132557 / TC161) TaxID=1328760 RepID=A0A165JF16_XYLHT|nr:hypothetical protein L228DRAFT_279391 [Xylona heveae TC161]KZF26151.1 hypothetical protein L228DRAFT_279391 [Xylona heveae TC161]